MFRSEGQVSGDIYAVSKAQCENKAGQQAVPSHDARSRYSRRKKRLQGMVSNAIK